jgi:protein-S-isoprenylcysteine O-methyltransferase Ste14
MDQPPITKIIPYRAAMTLGTLLEVIPAHGDEGVLRLWHVGWIGAWTCFGAIALGITFTWWARLHLGRLWSGRVTQKTEHRVVATGPYAIVRHPIYTGLLFALLATAAAKGTVLGIVGFLCMLIGISLKARLEEAWLCAQLPDDAYALYRARVPMLVPLWPTLRRAPQ